MQPLHLEKLLDDLAPLFGREIPLDQSAYALKSAVRRVRPGVIGVHHVTCSDEAERENAETFQRCFVQDLVPRLKYGVQASLRTANLGARYEWHSLRVAESNFSPDVPDGQFKLMVTKINTHVAAYEDHGVVNHYGAMTRYGRPSTACGALHRFMADGHEPFCRDLDDLFHFEGKDRLAAIRQIDEPFRAAAVAVAAARLQARSAVLEAQDHVPNAPTVYLIVPAVTLNKPGKDGEVVIGAYTVDRRHKGREDRYRGLGDDPAAYHFSHDHVKLRVTDEASKETRVARDHRQLAVKRLRAMSLPAHRDPKIDRLLSDAKQTVGTDAHTAKKIGLALIPLIADANPISAALALFGGGVTGIYDIYRINKLVRQVEGSVEARAAVSDLEKRLAGMSPEQIEGVLEVLLRSHK